MNILIIKLGALGDVVMATALIRAIQQHHPGQTCHLLTTPAFAPIFDAWPDLHVSARPRRGWRNTLAVLRYIRALNVDAIYDLQGNDRTSVWTACSGARERIGSPARYPYTHHPADAWTGQCHIFERMTAVLASVGITNVTRQPYLPADERDRTVVERFIAEHELEPRTFALLHAGASAARPEKRWPYFAELAQRLGAAGVRPVWLGTDADRARNRALVEAAGGIDASGALGIKALAELGRHAGFAVTNDSGPMHVLAASGIPVFGLFGPSDWRRNHALGQERHVIACVDACAEYAGRRTGDCLDRITVELVWQRLSEQALV